MLEIQHRPLTRGKRFATAVQTAVASPDGATRVPHVTVASLTRKSSETSFAVFFIGKGAQVSRGSMATKPWLQTSDALTSPWAFWKRYFKYIFGKIPRNKVSGGSTARWMMFVRLEDPKRTGSGTRRRNFVVGARPVRKTVELYGA